MTTVCTVTGKPTWTLKGVILSTFHPKSGDIRRKWYVIDATDVILGRLATRAADSLRGKGEAYFAPNVDYGDHVIIINADGVYASSSKWEHETHHHHSNSPGGLKSMTLGRSLEVYPRRVIAEAIEGMMPHNKLSRTLIKKLYVFASSEHPFAGQKPENYEIKVVA